MTRIASLGLIIILLAPAVTLGADLGVIRGHVRDSGGTPLVGALVIVVASTPDSPERFAFTDKRGQFSIQNLFAGNYSIRVTMSSFLPSFKNGIHLNAGGSAILTVNLQNALDIVRRAREKASAEDIVWTLRSSRSTQPVLRLAESQTSETPVPIPSPDYTGYFQVYSKSVETSSGISEGVGSQFSVTMPLAATSKVTVAVSYTVE